MRNQPWDKLSSVIEQARLGDQASFHWPSYSNRRYWVWVEWNGGLPIIGYEDLNTGAIFHDVTAIALVSFLESCE